jgi:hypothetical protein
MTTPATLRADAAIERANVTDWEWVAAKAAHSGVRRGERAARKQAQKHAAKANKLDGMADRMERKRRVWLRECEAVNAYLETGAGA